MFTSVVYVPVDRNEIDFTLIYSTLKRLLNLLCFRCGIFSVLVLITCNRGRICWLQVWRFLFFAFLLVYRNSFLFLLGSLNSQDTKAKWWVDACLNNEEGKLESITWYKKCPCVKLYRLYANFLPLHHSKISSYGFNLTLLILYNLS